VKPMTWKECIAIIIGLLVYAVVVSPGFSWGKDLLREADEHSRRYNESMEATIQNQRESVRLRRRKDPQIPPFYKSQPSPPAGEPVRNPKVRY